MISREFFFAGDDYRQEIILRERILRLPLGLKLTAEDCAKDPLSFHLGGFVDGVLVAVLLLDKIDDSAMKMRQVAVETSLQRSGAGSRLVGFAEDFAKRSGFRKIFAHARKTALPFYKKLGYEISGDTFLEIGLPHFLVSKNLD